MPLDLLRSPSTLDAFLMFLLLAWLGGSAAMTILASLAERRHDTAIASHSSPASRPQRSLFASSSVPQRDATYR